MPGEFIARQGLISRGNVVVTGSLTTSGSLTTTGTITATTLVVQTITSSISSVTGSTNFGSLVSNTHTFTGSLNVTGALAVTTNGTEFQVTNTGVNLGNALTDSHVISGSVRINPNGLFVSGSGLVGIGTTSPLALLDVCVLSSGARRLLVNYADSIVTVKSSNDSSNGENLRVWGDNIFFYTGSAGSGGELMRLTNTGRVGIGTSNPDNLLEVYGTGTNTTRIRVRGTTNFALFQSQNDSSSAFYLGIDSSTASGFNVGNYSRIIWSGGAYPLVFATNDVERMRITSGGYTKMTNNGVISYPNGTIHELRQTAADYVYYTINASATPFGAFFDYTTAAPNGTGNSYIVCADTSVTRFAVRSNGGVYNYSANNVNLSDISTKKDIIPCESYWNKFKAIEIVKFKYKDQSHDDYNIGVIAQQIEEVAPEFIDTDDWSKPDEEEKILKAVYAEDLHHATIKVLQEAMAKIETLETEIEELKARI